MKARHGVGLAAVMVLAGCSASGETGRSGRGAPAAGATGGQGAGQAGTTGPLGGNAAGAGGTSGTPGGIGTVTGIDEGQECAGVEQEAGNKPAPIDIIFAIDTSGSMTFETMEVQNNMNVFAEQIVNAGLDVQVVLLSELQGDPFDMLPPGFPPPPPGFFPKMGICIPAPLGSGTCPEDSNPPGFFHLPQIIASTDSLIQLLMQYPSYKPSLRQKSLKYFVVVTDDESSMPPDQFISGVSALDPGWFDSWKFFGVFCFDTMCLGLPPPCETAGAVYRQLVDMTGGQAGSLCMGQSDFQSVFTALAQQVIQHTELACEWDIPPLPPGETMFFKNRVNVSYTPGSGGPPQDIYWVNDASKCGSEGGWYYDNNDTPTKVLACSKNCETMKVDLMGKVDIRFGCLTIARPD